LLATISDPINTMNESMSYFEPGVERRDAVMANRRMLLEQQRSILQSGFEERRHLRGPDSTLPSSFGTKEEEVQRISEEVSKLLAKDIASRLDMNTISSQLLQQLEVTKAIPKEGSNEGRSPSDTSRASSISEKANKPVKVFILMGQSNMAGQGEVSSGNWIMLQGRCYLLHRFSHVSSICQSLCFFFYGFPADLW
jgi:hypothetical protein